jgi:hypothetical protein
MVSTRWLIVFPILSSTAWITTLLSLLILWLTDGRPRYEETSPDVAFISNIGSHFYRLFMIGSIITATFFVVTLFVFIFYHHHLWKNRIGNIKKPRTWSDFVSFSFGIVASVALILLSIYDSQRYDDTHWIFTLIFAFSAILCALFNIVSISISRGMRRTKMSSFILKIIFVILSTILVITMVSLMYSCQSHGRILVPRCNELRSIAAILEWSLAALFFVFILTWVIDFA